MVGRELGGVTTNRSPLLNLLNEDKNTRPDVFVQFLFDKGICLDVTVRDTWAFHKRKKQNITIDWIWDKKKYEMQIYEHLTAAEKKKNGIYFDKCGANNYEFYPVAMDTWGAFGIGGTSRLITGWAKQLAEMEYVSIQEAANRIR